MSSEENKGSACICPGQHKWQQQCRLRNPQKTHSQWVLSDCCNNLRIFIKMSFLFNTTMAVKYLISDWTRGFHFDEEKKNMLNQNENQKTFTSDWKKYVISPQNRFLSVEISPLFSGLCFFFSCFGGRTEKVKYSKGVGRSDSIYESNWYRRKKQNSLQAQKGPLFLPALSACLVKAIPSSSKTDFTYLLSLSWLHEYIYWNSSY